MYVYLFSERSRALDQFAEGRRPKRKFQVASAICGAKLPASIFALGCPVFRALCIYFTVCARLVQSSLHSPPLPSPVVHKDFSRTVPSSRILFAELHPPSLIRFICILPAGVASPICHPRIRFIVRNARPAAALHARGVHRWFLIYTRGFGGGWLYRNWAREGRGWRCTSAPALIFSPRHATANYSAYTFGLL